MRLKKKILIPLFVILLIFSLSSQSVLEEAGKIMKLLGLDVPVFDLLLTDSEKDWLEEEKKTWDWWKNLYDDFCDVFDGRLRQLIERHTGFTAHGGGFDALIDNIEDLLDFTEKSIYYSEYLDRTILAKIRKRDWKKGLKKDREDESRNQDSEEVRADEAQEFREILLEPEAQIIYKSSFFYGQENGRTMIDNEMTRRCERLHMIEGFLNLLTQVKGDEERRTKELERRLSLLEEKSRTEALVSENAEGEAVTDTAGLLATMISITQDLAVVEEAVHKMIKYDRETDVQDFLNFRRSIQLIKDFK